MIPPYLQYSVVVIILIDFLVNSFYLKRTWEIYSKENANVGLLFLTFFTIRLLISIFQLWGILLYPEREMLSDTIALGGIFTGYLGIMILENYRSTTYNAK